jgi:hypothetical protein
VGLDERIDVLAKLGDGVEGRIVQRLALQDREPDFNLLKPRGPRRREVEVHMSLTLEPAVIHGEPAAKYYPVIIGVGRSVMPCWAVMALIGS